MVKGWSRFRIPVVGSLSDFKLQKSVTLQKLNNYKVSYHSFIGYYKSCLQSCSHPLFRVTGFDGPVKL